MPTLSLYLAVVVTWQRGLGLMNAAAWSSAVAISFGEMRIDALIWACYNTFLEKGKKVNKTHRYYFLVTVATDFWQSSDGFILWVPRLCSSRVVKKTNLQCETLYGCIPILSIPCKSPAISPTHVTSSKSPPLQLLLPHAIYSPLDREQLDDQRAAIAW